jgi:hypothetical protein
MTHHKMTIALPTLVLLLSGITGSPTTAQDSIDVQALYDALADRHVTEENEPTQETFVQNPADVPAILPTEAGIRGDVGPVFPTTHAELATFAGAHLPVDDRPGLLSSTCALIMDLGLEEANPAVTRCNALELGTEDAQ